MEGKYQAFLKWQSFYHDTDGGGYLERKTGNNF